MMFPDNWPNNHILNTLLVKYSIALFGAHSWSVRLPNLLSFLLFAWAVYRIACLLNPRSFWLPVTAVLFFANPYLLDFFGLSRGYGLSVALEMTAISFRCLNLSSKDPSPVSGCSDLLFFCICKFYFALVAFYVPVVASSYLEIGYKEEMAE